MPPICPHHSSCSSFFDKLSATLPYTDILFGNEDEASALGDKLEWGSDIKEIARRASVLPKANAIRARTVVFTQGAKPTVVYVGGVFVGEFQPLLLAKEKIVDTNGAGDSFVGGFLAALVQGHSLADSVKAGHYVAYECIQRSGCTFPEKPSYN